MQEIRYALRALRKTPVFTGVALVTLTLAIGANTAVFSLLNALVLRTLPAPRPDQLVLLHAVSATADDGAFSLPIFRAFARQQRSFSSIAGWLASGVFPVRTDTAGAAAAISTVTPTYFSMLGARPLLGRLLTDDDSDLATFRAEPVAVVGYAFWQRAFGGDPSALGRTVRIGDLPLTVVGVTPQGFMGFSLLVEPDITVPLPVLTHLMGVSVAEFEAGTVAPIRIIGRLRDGVTIEQARAEAQALWPAIREAALPASYTGPQRDRFLATRVDVKPAGKGLETRLRARYTQPLMIILGIAGLVLVIACVNLASMMLSRTATRIHEIGVRLALGADWWRLARQLIVEGLLLSIGGAVLGMAFAYWSSFAIVSVIFRDYLVPAGLNVAPDGRVLAFTAIVAVGVGILFSLAPAWKATRASALAALQHSTRTSTGTGRAGRWLVASQVALSLVLLTNAGLLIRTLQEIRAVPSGLLSDDVFVTFPGPPQGAYPPGDNDVYYPQVIGRLMALPGMQSVSVSLAKPAGGGSSQTTPVAGIAESDLLAHGVGTIRTAVSPRFFETLGIAMVSGRDFSFGDSSKARRVAIVSRSLGRRLFGDGLAIGQRIRVGIKPADQDVEVVGVASDARVYDLTNANPYAVYVPALQDPDADWKCFVFRGRGVPAPDVRRAVESLGREVLGATNSLSYITGRTLLQERMTAALAGFFAALALLLAAVGLYGLMAYTVAQRRREIGLRIALGAEPRRVMADVVRDGVSVALAGIGVGFAGALAAVQLVRSLLFGVAPHDPLTLAAAPASLLAVTVLACLAPAARAARVDPMISLRSE